jgi:outer membrane protein OmpA-like peptidoglycan-associated protein
MTFRHLVLALAVALPLPAAAESFTASAPATPPHTQLVVKVQSFDFGRIYVHTDERQELWRIANLWRQRPHWSTITVEGHGLVASDEEASIALGEKRAQRVRDLLVKYGVDPRFVRTVGNSRDTPGRYVVVTVDTCEHCRR